MTNAIIISICLMLLLAYLAEISSERTKIPAVLMLLFLGWLTGLMADLLQWKIPDLKFLLPLFGTIGLILIVLEGALELEFNKSKLNIIKKSVLMATAPMLIMALIFAFVFSEVGNIPFRTGLINAIPLCVISSSIAIPGARNISYADRELVIYESSFSDVIGVLLFNFVLANQLITASSMWFFLLQVILISLISILAVLGLSYLLGRIEKHITYTPIILLVILIYALAKEFHLSGLLFILVFGLFLGNISDLKRTYLSGIINFAKLHTEVVKFKSITIEATFIVRSLFFLLFGFLMKTHDFLNARSLPWAVGIIVVILGTRWLFLKLIRLPATPLLYFSPRGLITVLLFISIIPSENIPIIDNSLIVQVIIISVLVMLAGLLTNSKFSKKTVS